MLSEIKVRNTLGRRIEIFQPNNPPLVNMYVCGPTPYDYTHIGHARTFVAFDGIKRYLNLRGYNVFHIQNITDIDDKIINRSKEKGISWKELVNEYTKDYLEMLKTLNIHVDIHPKVTEHISDIITFIQGLIDKGYAYVAESGSVYFEVDKYPDYGRLSGRTQKTQWSQEEEYAHEKKNPYDFALWKAAKPGEPSWESPWGPGRPGWHIECSVMSTKYAGETLDIHGGAADLIFPHHENERAQSEAFLGKKPWVKYWLHTGYLTIEGEKMSKSLGNIIGVREAVKEWGPGPLRLWLLSGHYRTQLEYSEQSLGQAKRLYERFRQAVYEINKRLESQEPSHYLRKEDLETLEKLRIIHYNWHREMSNDFNFAGALREVWEFTNLYFKTITSSESQTVLLYAYKLGEEMNKVYAIADDLYYKAEKAIPEISESLIDLIVQVRTELRKNKMYDLADQIRSKLLELGIQLKDYKDRTEWSWK